MGLDITGIGTLAESARGILGMIFPDKTEIEKAQIASAFAIIQSQTDTNRAEATNANMFVAGWRPFVGWVCGTGFGVQFVFGPLGEWVSALFGHPVHFPPMDLGTMMPLLFGLLGLGGMRTFEKVQGINSGH